MCRHKINEPSHLGPLLAMQQVVLSCQQAPKGWQPFAPFGQACSIRVDELLMHAPKDAPHHPMNQQYTKLSATQLQAVHLFALDGVLDSAAGTSSQASAVRVSARHVTPPASSQLPHASPVACMPTAHLRSMEKSAYRLAAFRLSPPHPGYGPGWDAWALPG